MEIFGISVIKNEVDIIEYSLMEASSWVSKVFVMDNGSDDGTWEKVNALAKRNPKIVAWKQSFEAFHDGIRSEVFNEFKHLAKNGDWWCFRLDADEIYIDNPRNFLASQVKPYYHAVCSKHIQYRLTDVDLEEKIDHSSIDDQLASMSYIEREATSELRFFKHRGNLVWNKDRALPFQVGLVCPNRILIRHYQYRSLGQIKKRLLARKNNPSNFSHITSSAMEDYIVTASDCTFDTKQLSLYNELPLSNNVNLAYRWWSFLIRRILQSVGIFLY